MATGVDDSCTETEFLNLNPAKAPDIRISKTQICSKSTHDRDIVDANYVHSWYVLLPYRPTINKCPQQPPASVLTATTTVDDDAHLCVRFATHLFACPELPRCRLAWIQEAGDIRVCY